MSSTSDVHSAAQGCPLLCSASSTPPCSPPCPSHPQPACHLALFQGQRGEGRAGRAGGGTAKLSPQPGLSVAPSLCLWCTCSPFSVHSLGTCLGMPARHLPNVGDAPWAVSFTPPLLAHLQHGLTAFALPAVLSPKAGAGPAPAAASVWPQAKYTQVPSALRAAPHPVTGGSSRPSTFRLGQQIDGPGFHSTGTPQ